MQKLFMFTSHPPPILMSEASVPSATRVSLPTFRRMLRLDSLYHGKGSDLAHHLGSRAVRKGRFLKA